MDDSETTQWDGGGNEDWGINDEEIGIYISDFRLLESYWRGLQESRKGLKALLADVFDGDPAEYARVVMRQFDPGEYIAKEFVYFPVKGRISEGPTEKWSVKTRLEFNLATGMVLSGMDLVLPEGVDSDTVPEDGTDLFLSVIQGYNEERAKEFEQTRSRRRAHDSGYVDGRHECLHILN